MKTAKEWLLEQLKEFPNHDEYDPKAVDAIADFMEHYAKYYHQQQVKSVDLADVVRLYPDGRDSERYFKKKVLEDGDIESMARWYFFAGIEYLKLAISDNLA